MSTIHTSPLRSPLAFAAVAVLLMSALSGCIGETEPTGPDLPAETSVSFDSFEDALSADGPTFKPAGEAVPYEDSQQDSVSSQDYSQSYDVPVEAHGDEIGVEATFDSGSQLDDLTFALVDPDGNEADSASVGPDTAEANLTAEAPSAGNWTVSVDGQAISASYELAILVTYENTHPLTLKLFEPAEPIPPGDQAFAFLLYDEDESEPIVDANVSLESWATSMGHGSSNEEADPVHAGDGLWVGEISPSMDGSWVVRVDVDRGDGDTVRFEVPIEMKG